MNQPQSSRSNKECESSARRNIQNTTKQKGAIKEPVTYALIAILKVREFGCCQTGESFDCISFSILRDVRHSPAIPQLQTRGIEKKSISGPNDENNMSPVHQAAARCTLIVSRMGGGGVYTAAKMYTWYTILMLAPPGHLSFSQSRSRIWVQHETAMVRWHPETVGTTTVLCAERPVPSEAGRLENCGPG